jgi:hypothetical protein
MDGRGHGARAVALLDRKGKIFHDLVNERPPLPDQRASQCHGGASKRNSERRGTLLLQMPLAMLDGASFVVDGAAQARESALITASPAMKWQNGWAAAAPLRAGFPDATRL